MKIILLVSLLVYSSIIGAKDFADVDAVSVSGSSHSYRFAVTIKSPDTGCKKYANWWEVLNSKGELLYRRILAHSHVDEQPFTRSGGPIKASADEQLTIRAHMYPSGYGGTVMVGSVASGFTETLEKTPIPLIDKPKTTCAF